MNRRSFFKSGLVAFAAATGLAKTSLALAQSGLCDYYNSAPNVEPNAQFVYDNIGPAFTPGHEGTPGERTSVTALSTLAATGLNQIVIQSEADARQYSKDTNYGVQNGTGTFTDPYIIKEFTTLNPMYDAAVITYTNLTGAFTTGQIVSGATTGSGTIAGIIDDGGNTGRLFITGTTYGFDAGLITDTAVGSATFASETDVQGCLVYFVDPDADYHVKIVDSRVITVNGYHSDLSQIFLNYPASASLTFEYCTMYDSGGNSARLAMYEHHGAGPLTLDHVEFSGHKFAAFHLSGLTTLTVQNTLINGAGGRTANVLVANYKHGAIIDFYQVTLDYESNSWLLFRPWGDFSLNVSRSIFGKYSKAIGSSGYGSEVGITSFIDAKPYRAEISFDLLTSGPITAGEILTNTSSGATAIVVETLPTSTTEGRLILDNLSGSSFLGAITFSGGASANGYNYYRAQTLQLPKMVEHSNLFMGRGSFMGASSSAVKNLTIDHCYLYGASVGRKVLEFGPTGVGVDDTYKPITTQTNFPENITVSWSSIEKEDRGIILEDTNITGTFEMFEEVTWWDGETQEGKVIDVGSGFIRIVLADTFNGTADPFTPGVVTGTVSGATTSGSPGVLDSQKAGNEVIDSYRAKNVIYEYCWIQQGGEDGYEYHHQQGGCKVRYCGAGHIGDTEYGLHGQIIDFFQTPDSGHPVRNPINGIDHIFGKSGGQLACNIDETPISNILFENPVSVNGFDIQTFYNKALISIGNSGQNLSLSGKRTPDVQCRANTFVTKFGNGAGTWTDTTSVSVAQVPGPLSHRDMLARFSFLTHQGNNAFIQLIKAEEAMGTWDEIDEIFVFPTNSSDGLIGLKGVATLTEVGGDSLVWGSEGVTTTRDCGLQMSVSLDNLVQFTQNDCEVGLWSQANNNTTHNASFFGVRDDVNFFDLRQRNITHHELRTYVNSTGYSPFDAGMTLTLPIDSRVLWSIRRTEATVDGNLYRDGVKAFDGYQSSSAIPDNPLVINGRTSSAGVFLGNSGLVQTMSCAIIGRAATNPVARAENIRRMLLRLGVTGTTW